VPPSINRRIPEGKGKSGEGDFSKDNIMKKGFKGKIRATSNKAAKEVKKEKNPAGEEGRCGSVVEKVWRGEIKARGGGRSVVHAK